MGTENDLSGYIIEDENENGRAITFPEQIGGDDSGVEYSEIFTITGQEVTGLLVSSLGHKEFYLSDLPYGTSTILLYANLHHSLEDYDDGETQWPHLDEMVKFGICYRDYSTAQDTYVFIPVFSRYLLESELGEEIIASCDVDYYLRSNVCYYSFIKHRYYTGYVYGTLGLYYM